MEKEKREKEEMVTAHAALTRRLEAETHTARGELRFV
jgi:hypothetical protein